MNNEKYNYYKQKHPEWSDEQIWTAVSLDMESTKVIENKGADVDPNDPDLIANILKGAKVWLEEVLPTIFEKVKTFLDDLITNISNWVQKGLSYVLEAIEKYLGKNKI